MYKEFLEEKETKEKKRHLPWFYIYTRQGDYNVLVMDLLGPSIKDILDIYRKFGCGKFPMRTVLILAEKMIEALSTFIARGSYTVT
jgi:hypothetical protein